MQRGARVEAGGDGGGASGSQEEGGSDCEAVAPTDGELHQSPEDRRRAEKEQL